MPAITPHAYLEKLNLLKVTVFLMKSVKFSAWTSRGFLWAGWAGGEEQALLVLGPCPGGGGDLHRRSAALHRAPAPDLTGPVCPVEHHALACFYALKT